MWIGPSRQARYHVEFTEQPGNLIGVGFFGEAIGLGDDAKEGGFNVLDGLRGVVLALGLQALVMFDEFVSVELP